MAILKTKPDPVQHETDDPAQEARNRPEGEPKIFRLDPLPDHIKPGYKRLALITHGDHLAHLDPDDQDTLIVSCNWLLWQEALLENRHCVHYELGIISWDEPNTLDKDLYIRANDWLYGDDGRDMTLFHGVSLGKLFCTDIAMGLMNFHRAERSLVALIKRFGAEEIVYFDFANDISVLDRDLRRDTIRNIAEKQGLRFSNRSGANEDDRLSMSENPTTLRGHGFLKNALLFFYTYILEALTNIRCFAVPRQRRVLVIANNNLSEPLVKTFQGGGLTPIFMSRAVPKTIPVLWHCIKKGVLLISPRNAALDAKDEARLKAIQIDLEAAFAKPGDAALVFARAFVSRQILTAGRLAPMARDILAAERIIDRYRPKRVVVDGKRNHPVRTYMELASARGIETDHMWHSPLVPQYLQFDAFGCDPREEPIITRCLSWGRINEAWLDAIEARPPRVRIGCPLSDRYAKSKPLKNGKGKNALVLQYAPIVSDLRSLNSTLYSLFIDIIRLLNDKGFDNIRFKLHPGPGRWKKNYFAEIARTFAIRCEILKTEPFEECVAWADIVVGPVASGALFETLATGKPYHAMLMPPHSMNPEFYGDYPINTSVEELDRALDRPIPPEAARNLLDGLYSIEKFPSGSKRFWEVMEQSVA